MDTEGEMIGKDKKNVVKVTCKSLTLTSKNFRGHNSVIGDKMWGPKRRI